MGESSSFYTSRSSSGMLEGVILHVNATSHPTADWVVQHMRETFPDEASVRYLSVLIIRPAVEI
jgi:hypothetical protein